MAKLDFLDKRARSGGVPSDPGFSLWPFVLARTNPHRQKPRATFYEI
jgi:hypothetical protein